MLGYVRIFKPELKIKEYEVYRGAYCSLCRNLGRRYSPFAQLFLSYDFTLLAMFVAALKPECSPFEKCRCPYNPAKKCHKYSDKHLPDKCADALIITVYYKLIDNMRDKGLGKKIISVLLFPYIFFAHKKAKRLSPDIESIISGSMKLQKETEENPDCSLDEAAHPSAKALSEIFALFGDGTDTDAIKRFGYMAGRFVYIIDAADDIESDIRRCNFNPLKDIYNEDKNLFVNSVKQSLNYTINEARASFYEINIRRYKTIFENIFDYGLKKSADKVLLKYSDEKREGGKR